MLIGKLSYFSARDMLFTFVRNREISVVKIHWVQDVSKLTSVSFLISVCISHKSGCCACRSTPQCHQQIFLYLNTKMYGIGVFHLMKK